MRGGGRGMIGGMCPQFISPSINTKKVISHSSINPKDNPPHLSKKSLKKLYNLTNTSSLLTIAKRIYKRKNLGNKINWKNVSVTLSILRVMKLSNINSSRITNLNIHIIFNPLKNSISM